MNVGAAMTAACAEVPGLVRAALVLLPDGFFLGSAGGARMLDLEPLIRAAARSLAQRPAVGGNASAPLVESLLVLDDSLVVIQAGRREPRLALVLECTREPNLALVQQAARVAIAALEAAIDLDQWGMAS